MKFEMNVLALGIALTLEELMMLIPEDQFVIVFDQRTGTEDGFREEDAIFNGQVRDFQTYDPKDEPARLRLLNLKHTDVMGVQAAEIGSVVGPVLMVVVI